MSNSRSNSSIKGLIEIAFVFLKLGLTAFGGPAIIGIMQNELQEKRKWVSKERFIEGLSLVNLLPGAAATQLGMFLAYSRNGLLSALVAGICFILPAFFIMLILTISYSLYGETSIMRGAVYGLGSVVMGIFLVAVLRLGKVAVTSISQFSIALLAALLIHFSSIGIISVFFLAAGVGLFINYSRKVGLIFLFGLIVVLISYSFVSNVGILKAPVAPIPSSLASTPGLSDIGLFFLKTGSFSFGGGLSVIAFIQEQVVNQNSWLTQKEFVVGLSLGQFTPGPILMVSAYVGYNLAGLTGAIVATLAIFLPAFVFMLSVLPVFEKVRNLMWMKAAMKGISPGVIGVLSVSLAQMIPAALTDSISISLFAISIAMLLIWKFGAIKLMLLGACFGILVTFIII